MLILGISTSTSQVGCAIGGHEGVLASMHSNRGKRHAETLTPAIDFIRRQARIELSEIGAVAVDVGPGLFTGLRVGVSAGKAIAQALRVPMVGVSSLDLLAFPLRHTQKRIVAILDARRSEVFHAQYLAVPGGVQRVSEPSVDSPDDLIADLLAIDDEFVLVGDGATRYAEVFDGVRKAEIAEQFLAHPSATTLVQLAHAKALREDFVRPWDIEPVYIRPPDAEINWQSRAGRTSS